MIDDVPEFAQPNFQQVDFVEQQAGLDDPWPARRLAGSECPTKHVRQTSHVLPLDCRTASWTMSKPSATGRSGAPSAAIARPQGAFPCAAAAGADSAAAVALPRALPQAPAMLISVVVPVFNRELVLRRCVDSVLAQEFGDFELILVDDGSTDNSLQHLREYDEPRMRVLAQGRNMGVGAARNAGAETAMGEWIVFLDSDDELVPGALRLIAELAAASSEAVGSLWFRCRMDDGRLCPEQLSEPREWDYAGYVGFLDATVG